jgi:hypothetical protein
MSRYRRERTCERPRYHLFIDTLPPKLDAYKVEVLSQRSWIFLPGASAEELWCVALREANRLLFDAPVIHRPDVFLPYAFITATDSDAAWFDQKLHYLKEFSESNLPHELHVQVLCETLDLLNAAQERNFLP